MAALFKFEPEIVVEERIARLEVNVEHIQSDVSEMKVDIRQMRQEYRQDVKRLDDKIDTVKDSVATLALTSERSFTKVEKSIHSAKIWAFGLYVALAAGLLFVLARGFKWI